MAKRVPSSARILSGLLASFLVVSTSVSSQASVFGDVRGVVLDPQARPIAGATVALRAERSTFERSASTDPSGEFVFRAVPLGEYALSAESPGFSRIERAIAVVSDNASPIRLRLPIAPLTETTEVAGRPVSDSPTPITLVDRQEINETPGADRTNSLAMITNNVP